MNIIEFKFLFLFNFIFEFNNIFNIIKSIFGNASNFIKGTSRGRNSVVILINNLGPIFNYYFIRVFILNGFLFGIKFRFNSKRSLIVNRGRGSTFRINIRNNYNKK